MTKSWTNGYKESMRSTRIQIKFNDSTHEMMENSRYIKKKTGFSVIPVPLFTSENFFSFIISKYALPQPRLYFKCFWLKVTSDARDDGEIYKNLVHPINVRQEKSSTKYCHIQTTPPYERGRKLSPLMLSNEAMFTSNWPQWRFLLNPY